MYHYDDYGVLDTTDSLDWIDSFSLCPIDADGSPPRRPIARGDDVEPATYPELHSRGGGDVSSSSDASCDSLARESCHSCRFLSLQLEEDEEVSAHRTRGAPTLMDRWGNLTHSVDGVLLAGFLSRANNTSPTQTRRSSPGRIAATLQCLNRVNSTGCIIARHSITLHPRPGLTVEIPEENKEEFCVELSTLMQQKLDGKKTARGSGEPLLPRGIFMDAGSSANHMDLDGEDAGVVASPRGHGSVKLILPPSATRPRSSQGSGNMLAAGHPLRAPQPIEGEKEEPENDQKPKPRVNPLIASEEAPTEMAGPSVTVPRKKQKGVVGKGRAAGNVKPRHGTTHGDSASSSSVKMSGKKPSRGGFFSRICCIS
ncbi:2,4-dienoyl-coa reductase-like protein, putative [Trypanosoma cruzi marinkellei]|uniref:2,4-dienoyl-coa reductase-like protein, putative n=1 Tax=Trypanosoma cruzi marinkellei TaxID=85056 RepID=K2NG05_TRYCR|nr:2,4-dienoyl-coa reductase-like protein, putative [Trypanosoma cruzi marinkellei]